MMSYEELGTLRFECQKCGGCCTGAPGYVFLNKNEIQAISNFLQLNEKDFLNAFCRKIVNEGKHSISLKEKANFDCIFLENQQCQIYELRPIQCRTYPFWPRILESRKSWEKEKQNCPGIGKGSIIGINEIQRRLNYYDHI